MNLYNQFKTDTAVEKQGVILQYGKNSKGEMIGIRIARAGGANQRFNSKLEARTKPYARQLQARTMDRDVLAKLMREVYAETVVIGWENVEDENGEPLEFNFGNVVKLFTDLPDLFDDVVAQAGDAALFRAELREAAAGN